jgi:hypothetical protein
MSRVHELQVEIAKIREECKHDKGYTVGNWSWRPGTWWPSRICNNCAMAIDGLTKEEEKKFLDDEAQRQKDWEKANNP